MGKRKYPVGAKCALKDCNELRYSLDWCCMHYKRWQRNGDPEIVTQVEPGDPVSAHKDRVARWEAGEGKYLVNLHRNILQRCLNPNNNNWNKYGARGIAVYEPWVGPGGYRRFADWIRENIGERPDDTHPNGKPMWSINRLDNDGNYEPGNLEWADDKTQANNRRNNKVAA